MLVFAVDIIVVDSCGVITGVTYPELPPILDAYIATAIAPKDNPAYFTTLDNDGP